MKFMCLYWGPEWVMLMYSKPGADGSEHLFTWRRSYSHFRDKGNWSLVTSLICTSSHNLSIGRFGIWIRHKGHVFCTILHYLKDTNRSYWLELEVRGIIVGSYSTPISKGPKILRVNGPIQWNIGGGLWFFPDLLIMWSLDHMMTPLTW